MFNDLSVIDTTMGHENAGFEDDQGQEDVQPSTSRQGGTAGVDNTAYTVMYHRQTTSSVHVAAADQENQPSTSAEQPVPELQQATTSASIICDKYALYSEVYAAGAWAETVERQVYDDERCRENDDDERESAAAEQESRIHNAPENTGRHSHNHNAPTQTAMPFHNAPLFDIATENPPVETTNKFQCIKTGLQTINITSTMPLILSASNIALSPLNLIWKSENNGDAACILGNKHIKQSNSGVPLQVVEATINDTEAGSAVARPQHASLPECRTKL